MKRPQLVRPALSMSRVERGTQGGRGTGAAFDSTERQKKEEMQIGFENYIEEEKNGKIWGGRVLP